MSQGGPTFSPEQQRVFGLQRQMLQDYILPYEEERLGALSNLSAGNFAGADSILSPAMSAARMGQSRLKAALSELPRNVAAPIEEAAAWQVQGLPRRLQQAAPDELARMTQSLLAPQFGGLLTPGSSSSTSGGGGSPFERNMAIGGTLVSIAAIGVAI